MRLAELKQNAKKEQQWENEGNRLLMNEQSGMDINDRVDLSNIDAAVENDVGDFIVENENSIVQQETERQNQAAQRCASFDDLALIENADYKTFNFCFMCSMHEKMEAEAKTLKKG